MTPKKPPKSDKQIIEEILSAKEPPGKGVLWEEWDERENAIDSLEQVVEFLDDKYINRRAKRVSVALDHALYSFTVCAVTGTNFERVLIKENGDLIGFKTALKRVKAGSPYMQRFVFGRPVIISKEHEKHIEIIHRWANNFKHYLPKLELTRLDTFPDVVRNVVEVIKSVYGSGDFPIYQLSEEQKERVQRAFDNIDTLTRSWKEQIKAVSKPVQG